MTAQKELIFNLKGERNGVALAPGTFDISELVRFMKEVDEFLRPESATASEKAHDPITLTYEEGSVQLRVGMSVQRRQHLDQLMSHVREPRRLQSRDQSTAVGYDLSGLAPKQRKVLRDWHRRSQATGDKYRVLVPDEAEPAVLLIDKYTTLLEAAEDTWIPTQQYLHGLIQELGGIKKADIVMQVEGKSYTIKASQEVLANQERNRLYHETIVRVVGERHLQTGELRNLVLLAFVDYAPAVDRRLHDRATSMVTAAFADVPNLPQWVNQLRGE